MATVVWQGRSLLDGSPIRVILTGLDRKSTNRKTGEMVQAWILPARARPNKQVSICGDCPVKSACYVNWGWAPSAIWRGKKSKRDVAKMAPLLAGKMLRIGAAGDPAAVPTWVWRELTRHVAGWNGYTHQWKTCDPKLAAFAMASVESTPDRLLAKARGFRTFRIRAAHMPVGDYEVVCPASDEGGHRTTCENCGLCKGSSRPAKDIVIIGHGAAAKRLIPIVKE